ncbi:methyltransferase domain-containing protein [Parvibaculaceae bacterium PLY_AMNH_Bact1]|nr:methyltransferase domain-containing protein [Parvibaculaceae bacterium PLY_AMNH_Bact1]
MKRQRPHPTQEQVADDFDRVTQDYSQTINDAISFGGSEHSFYIDVKRRHILRLVEEELGSPATQNVLDLGCGIGAYHAGLEGCFRQLHGAEISAKSLSVAKELHPWVQYAHYDGRTLPYPDGQFSVVFAVCVMHHVPPPQWTEFIDEIHRVLVDGGMALIFEHNPYNPATQYVVKSCDIDKDAVLLKPAHLRKMFRDSHFQDVRTRTIISVPPKGGLLSKLDTWLGALPFGAQYYLSARK